MSAPGHLWHLFRVATTLARTGAAAEILRLTPLGAKRKRLIMLALVPLKPFGLRGDPAQPPLPRALYALGPAYVKLGQMLSTRPDIVGPALMAELRMLQDALPPFPDAVARAAIAEDLGRPLEALFSDFGPPLAAASLAQVHKATTKDGQPVAVKVLRPGIERSFRRAIAAQEFAARWTERLIPSTRRLKPVAIARDFREVSERELDLRMEAAAASEFAENTKDDDGFRLPGVHWGLSGGRVLSTD